MEASLVPEPIVHADGNTTAVHARASNGQEEALMWIRIVADSMRYGDVRCIRTFLRDSRVQTLMGEFGGDEGSAIVAEARSWFASAEAYEATHGRGSLLDRTDPFVRNVLLPADEWFRRNHPIQRRGPEGSPTS